MTLPTEDQLQAALATVEDPEIRRPITEIGMVKSATVDADVSKVYWFDGDSFIGSSGVGAALSWTPKRAGS